VLLHWDTNLNAAVSESFCREIQFLMYAVLLFVGVLAFILELFFYKYDSPNEREPGFFDFLWEDETLGGEKIKKAEDAKSEGGKAKVE
jgi:hypothetical protein